MVCLSALEGTLTRLLILGGAGMLGHKLWQQLHREYETWITLRADFAAYDRYRLFEERRTIAGVDADEFDNVVRAFDVSKPEVVVNAIGVVKQLPAARDPIVSISINSLFPHRLATLCSAAGARLIHVGTDCVFSGQKGMYTEDDPPDADDLYGRSKCLGEVVESGHLTLRTSIIGREMNSRNGLVEWFLSNRGQRVKGFRRAIFSGLTTVAFADVVGTVIRNHPDLRGLYHVSSDPIDKYSLLELMRTAFRAPVDIEPADDVTVDRSLDSTRFRRATGWSPAPWTESIQGMAIDPTPYERWHAGDSSG